MKKEEKEITKKDEAVPSLFTGVEEKIVQLKEAFVENMEGLDVAIEMIKVPKGEATKWTINSIDGEETVSSIDGIIIGHHTARGYWEGEFGSNQPPQCFSQDGVTGVGNPGGNCFVCPKNQWKSNEKTGGKACQEKHRIFLIRAVEGKDMPLIPLIIQLPVTSIKPVSVFMTKLAMNQVRFWSVITRISLETATNRKGIKYPRAKVEMIEKLDKGLLDSVRSIKDGLTPILKNRPIDNAQEVDGDVEDVPF